MDFSGNYNSYAQEEFKSVPARPLENVVLFSFREARLTAECFVLTSKQKKVVLRASPPMIFFNVMDYIWNGPIKASCSPLLKNCNTYP